MDDRCDPAPWMDCLHLSGNFMDPETSSGRRRWGKGDEAVESTYLLRI
ncbi:hypothetical protein [Pseudoalteromonas sp. MMG005]|nr:hypothetical protein [Pseudoalteromonas sp. MMG005]MBQ4845250.1 hypothetical protein [Pseudoalteromonas sp. MMG005]